MNDVMPVWMIWSNEHGAWWGPGEVGYTSVIEAAGRYTLKDARRIVARAAAGGTVERPGAHGQRLHVMPEMAVFILSDAPDVAVLAS